MLCKHSCFIFLHPSPFRGGPFTQNTTQIARMHRASEHDSCRTSSHPMNPSHVMLLPHAVSLLEIPLITFTEPHSVLRNNSFVAGFLQCMSSHTTVCPPVRVFEQCESLCQPCDGQLCECEHATCGGYVQDCHGQSMKLKPCAFTVHSLLSIHTVGQPSMF